MIMILLRDPCAQALPLGARGWEKGGAARGGALRTPSWSARASNLEKSLCSMSDTCTRARARSFRRGLVIFCGVAAACECRIACVDRRTQRIGKA